MPSNEPIVIRSLAATDDLDPAPIAASRLLGGTPTTRARRVPLLDGGSIGASIWETTAGTFDWVYGSDEVIVILAGEAEVTSPNGAVTTFRVGDLVHFPGGQVVRWHVPVYVRKIALTAVRDPLARQLARRVPLARRVAHAVRGARARSAT